MIELRRLVQAVYLALVICSLIDQSHSLYCYYDGGGLPYKCAPLDKSCATWYYKNGDPEGTSRCSEEDVSGCYPTEEPPGGRICYCQTNGCNEKYIVKPEKSGGFDRVAILDVDDIYLDY